MPTRELTLVTRVTGATQAAAEVGKIEGAIDKVGAKVKSVGAKVNSFLDSSGVKFLAQGAISSVGQDVLAGGNAATGPGGVAANVLGGGASGIMFGPAGVAAGIATGIAKSAIEIGKATSTQSSGVLKTGEDFLASNPTLEQLNSGIAALDAGMSDIKKNPLTFFLGGGDAIADLKTLKDKYEEQKRVLEQEGNDTQTALRSNANAIVGAINGLDLSVNVNVPVSVNAGPTPRVQYQPPTTTTANSWRGDLGAGR